MDHLSAAAQSAMMQSSNTSLVPPSPTTPIAPPTQATMAQTQPSAPPAVPTAEETIKAIVQSQGYAFLDRYVALHNLLTPFQQQQASLDHLFDLVVRHYEDQSVDESDVLLRFKAKVAEDRKGAGQLQDDLKPERKGPPMRMMDYGHP